MVTSGSETRTPRRTPVNVVVAAIVAGVTFGLVQLVVDGPSGSSASATTPAASASRTTASPSAPSVPVVRSAKDLRDGTVIVPQSAPGAYVVAGGAPLFVGAKADTVAAGATPVSGQAFADLAQRPADGTLVRAERQLFVYAGGAPLPVTQLEAIDAGKRRVFDVHPGVVKRIGDKGAFRYSAQYPADGTILRAGPDGDYYVVEAGVAKPTQEKSDAVVVDPEALTRAGSGGKWNRLKKA